MSSVEKNAISLEATIEQINGYLKLMKYNGVNILPNKISVENAINILKFIDPYFIYTHSICIDGGVVLIVYRFHSLKIVYIFCNNNGTIKAQLYNE